MKRLLGSFVALASATLAAACGSTPDVVSDPEAPPATAESAVTGCDVHAERSLAIVARNVLDDPARTAPGGAFAFMTTLGTFFAPTFDARYFIGEQFAPGRVRHAWPLTPEGKLDLTTAPYRLLAVVLRPEGTWSSLGELRLVFEAWSDGALGELVSFEYGMDWRKPAPTEAANSGAPANGAAAAARRAAWVATWRSLEDKPFGSPAYVDALASLVTAVTRDPAQLRTIAIEKIQSGPNAGVRFTSLGRGGWQGLEEKPLANTPPATWNARGFTWNSGGSCGGWSGGACAVTDPLPRLVESAENDLYAGTFTIPADLRARDIVGTKTSTWGKAFSAPAGWAPERWERARRAFSRATCDGCHGSDTGTTSIQHVISQPSGDAKLSPFVRDQELPQRIVAYRATVCGPTALPSAITPVAAGTAIEVGATCATEGAIVSEPCGGAASGNKRYAVCVRDGARLVLSERTSCIDDRRPECSAGERGLTVSCGKCGTKQDYCFDFRWNGGFCSNQGVCEAGETTDTTAGCSSGSARTRTCSATCRWGDYGACTPR